MYQFSVAAVRQSVSDETAQWRSDNSRHAFQSKGRAGDVVDCWVTNHFNGRYKSDVFVQILIAEKAQSDAAKKTLAVRLH